MPLFYQKDISFKMGSHTTIFLTFFLIIGVNFFSNAQRDVAKINFKPVGADVAQPYFQKGLTLLHSFEYEEAIEQFKTAQLLDPDFIMATWGEAMCYNHPVCQRQEYEKGKGVLLKLGIFEEDRIQLAQNELEKGFLTAIEVLYRENEPKSKRDEDYLVSMKNLYDKFPGENEVKAFYALAILGKAISSNDEELLNQSTALNNEILKVNPNHPGALHYLMLSNELPLRAKDYLQMADNYNNLNIPTAYAFHIPSHIYCSLGKWDKLIKSNELSWKTADEKVVKKKLSLDDRDYHSFWWLQYGYIQQGMYEKSESMVKDMYQDARMSQSAKTRFHFLAMQTSYLVNSENWNSPVARLEVPTNELNITTKMAVLLTEGLKAYQIGDINRLRWVSERMTDQLTIEKNKGKVTSGIYYRNCCIEFLLHPVTQEDLTLAEAMEQEINGLATMIDGDESVALELLEKACELEDKATGKSGPPVTVKPTYELYGEILLKIGQPPKALEYFNRSLERYPNRALSLIGKYKALKFSGNNIEAAKLKGQILSNWKLADPSVKAKLD